MSIAFVNREVEIVSTHWVHHAILESHRLVQKELSA